MQSQPTAFKTESQMFRQKILNTIILHKLATGLNPTYAVMAKRLKTSPQRISNHMNILFDEGYLERYHPTGRGAYRVKVSIYEG